MSTDHMVIAVAPGYNNLGKRHIRGANTYNVLNRSIRLLIRKNKLPVNRGKTSEAWTALGCSVVEWKRHLESLFDIHQMRWDNWDISWQIAYIKPLLSFDMTVDEEWKQAFHYTNTHPLLFNDIKAGIAKIEKPLTAADYAYFMTTGNMTPAHAARVIPVETDNQRAAREAFDNRNK